MCLGFGTQGLGCNVFWIRHVYFKTGSLLYRALELARDKAHLLSGSMLYRDLEIARDKARLLFGSAM